MSKIDEKRLWIIEARDGAWGANGICKGELVRCRKCKWFAEYCDEYKKKSGKDGMCEHPTKEEYAINTTFDYYCADGERRTDEQQT